MIKTFIAAALAASAAAPDFRLAGVTAANIEAAAPGSQAPAAVLEIQASPTAPARADAAAPTFRSLGTYARGEQAALALDITLKALAGAKARVLSAGARPDENGGHFFEVVFLSRYPLSCHTGAALFNKEAEARESLRQAAALLADGERTIIAAEVIREPRGFSYAITALEGVMQEHYCED